MAASEARGSVWGPTAVRIRQSKLLRSPATVTYRALARVLLAGPPPKVLANSIPKAGTHLLTQLLAGVPKFHYAGMHIIDKEFRGDLDVPGDGLGEFDAGSLERRIKTVRNGQYVTSHMGLFPGMPEVLARHGIRPILMIRDPRDIVVSLAFYHAKNQRLATYDRFAKQMSSTDERLMAAITGLPAENGNPAFPSIGVRLSKYRPWLEDSATCVLRFEDLVGSSGGGSDERQRDCVRRVLQHCERYAGEGEALVDRLARSTYAEGSATFRRGAIGDWANHFTDEHQAAFDELAPGVLDAFGYASAPTSPPAESE